MSRNSKSPFILFVKDFIEEQQKRGIHYSNFGEAVKAADPSWRECPPSVRMKYEAKSRNLRETGSARKCTSRGIPINMIEKAEKRSQAFIEYEHKDILNTVTSSAYYVLKKLDVYVMDINCYCKAGDEYIVGEFSLVRFNIEDGILMTYHEIVNPDNIPMGYVYEVKVGAEELGLEMPDDEYKSNYIKLLANIIEYLKMKDQQMKNLPPIFTLPEKVPQIQNFIQQMCDAAGENEAIFRVYKLDKLFHTLINSLKTQSDEGFPKETLATIQLKKDVFKYSPGIACERHEQIDKSVECTQSRAKRWVYTVLDSCCPVAGVQALAGKHLPADYDLESIEIYQEHRKDRAGPSIAGCADVMSSFNSSTINASSTFNESINSTHEQINSVGSRKHKALRLPKYNYSENMNTAPELTEKDFPTLAASMTGRGFTSWSSSLSLVTAGAGAAAAASMS